MMITPLAAREPYKADAAASFRTVMDSISEGFRVLITLLLFTMYEDNCPEPPETTGTPSITYNGSLDAFMEPIPRIRIAEVEPACPEVEIGRASCRERV